MEQDVKCCELQLMMDQVDTAIKDNLYQRWWHRERPKEYRGILAGSKAVMMTSKIDNILNRRIDYQEFERLLDRLREQMKILDKTAQLMEQVQQRDDAAAVELRVVAEQFYQDPHSQEALESLADLKNDRELDGDEVLQHFIKVVDSEQRKRADRERSRQLLDQTTDFMLQRETEWWNFAENAAALSKEAERLREIIQQEQDQNGEVADTLRSLIVKLNRFAAAYRQLEEGAPDEIKQIDELRRRMQQVMNDIQSNLRQSNIQNQDEFRQQTDWLVVQWMDMKTDMMELLKQIEVAERDEDMPDIRWAVKLWLKRQQKLLPCWDKLRFVQGRDDGYMVVTQEEDDNFNKGKFLKAQPFKMQDDSSKEMQKLVETAKTLRQELEQQSQRLDQLKKLGDSLPTSKKNMEKEEAAKDKQEEEAEVKQYKQLYEQQMQCGGTASFIERLTKDLEVEILQNQHALKLDEDSRDSADPEDRWLDDKLCAELKQENEWKQKMIDYLKEYRVPEPTRDDNNKGSASMSPLMETIFNGVFGITKPAKTTGDKDQDNDSQQEETAAEAKDNSKKETETKKETKKESTKIPLIQALCDMAMKDLKSSPNFRLEGLLSTVMPIFETIAGALDETQKQSPSAPSSSTSTTAPTSCPVGSLFGKLSASSTSSCPLGKIAMSMPDVTIASIWKGIVMLHIITIIVIQPVLEANGKWLVKTGLLEADVYRQWKALDKHHLRRRSHK